MRQNGIEKNISEMQNVIKEAEDELNTNIKTKNDNKIKLRELKQRNKLTIEENKVKITKFEKDISKSTIDLTKQANRKNKIEGDLKDMGAYEESLRKYEDFIHMILGVDKEDSLEELVSSDGEESSSEEEQDLLFLTK